MYNSLKMLGVSTVTSINTRTTLKKIQVRVCIIMFLFVGFAGPYIA